MIYRYLKKSGLAAATLLGADSFCRTLNRKKLLVVMYHGVSADLRECPVWTQLPVAVFKSQLEFLRRHYRMVTLGEVVAALTQRLPLPERAALVTFDDGLKNNFTVAFPVLKELGIPASVFLTVDLIGTGEILWVDELYLLLKEALRRGVTPTVLEAQALLHFRSGRLWEAYLVTVESLKRAGASLREETMALLRRGVPQQRGCADFSLLNWDEVCAMQRSGLVEFGVHTASHRIVSELLEEEWEGELVAPKRTMEEKLQTEIPSFCFPNGRPGLDFGAEHLHYLRQAGYHCAFTTENALFDPERGDPMAIGRIAAGNDATSERHFFRLNSSGALAILRGARTKGYPGEAPAPLLQER